MIKNIRQPLIIIVSACLFAGCSVISSAKKSFIETSERKSATARYIDKTKIELMDEDLAQHLEDWSEMKKELQRVVKLSQEFEYVLKTLDEESSVLSDTNFDAPIPEFDLSLDTDADTQANDDKFSSTNPPTSVVNPSVLTTAARPLLSMDEAFSADSNMDNKFSGATLQGAATSAHTPEINKFSSLNPNVNPGYANSDSDGCRMMNEQEIQNAVGNHFGLHLASYKNRDNLKAGVLKLQSQFSRALCGKVAMSKSVVVKGVDYYSLRLGPFFDKDKAAQACAEIAKNKTYCKVTEFDGQRVML